MLRILSILALSTIHDLAKSCKKLAMVHMLRILSILALQLYLPYMILPNLVRNLPWFICYVSCQFLPYLPYMILPNLVRNLPWFICYVSCQFLPYLPYMILPNLVRNLPWFICYVSCQFLPTLHDLAKSCKKLAMVHMLRILSILAYLA